ncbi:ATP-binding protein [Streptomyces sp. BJ20]|uniref:ATP-binding protein n=1 Tax=Streptomyces sp. BJ20 TaxID=2930049 RepID=UPI0032B00112
MCRGGVRSGHVPLRGREPTDEVRDGGGALTPRPRRAHTTDEGGRGLYLVAELRLRWGVRPGSGGKVVRAGLGHPRTPRPSVPVRPAPASLAAA